MKKIVLIILVTIISSCGYHLRSSNKLAQNYPQLRLSLSSQSLLKRPLINALISSGVKLSEETHVNALVIKKDSLHKVIQSIGANNQVQEYRIEYDIEYSIGESDVRNIHLEKDYSFDIQQISGGQQEEQNLRKQMAEDMAWTIIRQINASIKN